ncbi:hypothetical protein GCM10009838_17290 [Catenulispora subtropica]|uniref:Double-GTPase 2 domain-containing protein n=2 Tax=Catenulispora subtropica TaxID=450798 RepID=A0ABN2R043_9ACTN
MPLLRKLTRTPLAPKPLTCPYCYERFPIRDILFRCNTRMSRTGRRCVAKTDGILEERTGNRRELGPVFSADGRKTTAVCPDCASETRYRVCPVCHSQLPTQFGLVDNLLIAMVGSKDSGKTVYMTVLLHEVMNRIGARLDASLLAADEHTLSRFRLNYEESLYAERRLPTTTTSAGTRDGRVDPLVFRFSVRRNGPIRQAPVHTLLSFFDAAGEDLVSQESVDLNTRYLANADGVLLLLDPLQMPGARQSAAPDTRLPGVGARYDTSVGVLTRITDMLLSQPGLLNRGLIDVPVAVVFPKLDAFRHRLRRGSPLTVEPPAGPRFDVADSLDVHTEMMGLLRDWDGVQIDQVMANNYRRYRYFGVSALGANPTSDAEVAQTGIQPYRVADPFVWLLSELGAVGREGRG